LLNYWWAKADRECTGRYLLIGDSVSRGYRGSLEKVLGMPVDYIGTSSLILDELFLHEIESFFDWGGVDLYRAIQVQIGIHGILEINTELNSDFYDMYKNQYQNLIEYLSEKTKRLVLASTTPVINRYWNCSNKYLAFIFSNLHPLCIEKINEQMDKELSIRNNITRDLAKEYGLAFNDLYSYMRNEGKKFRHIDEIHYEKKCNIFIARKVAEYFGNCKKN
ncbi:MAG: hypothetical protein OSJ44_13830, partial [Lachnospiraceae bacterium]|nr:hypothetical protein [Lachnospiraceae bacterium]